VEGRVVGWGGEGSFVARGDFNRWEWKSYNCRALIVVCSVGGFSPPGVANYGFDNVVAHVSEAPCNYVASAVSSHYHPCKFFAMGVHFDDHGV
jgi:hypothetical protein